MAVPWMVSPSVPELRIRIVENGHTVVGLDVASLPPLLSETSHLVNRGVEIRFAHGQWVRTHPSASDAAPVPPDVFDWSGVELASANVEDVDDWTRQFRTKWARERSCPDPRFYEVLESRWIAEENAQRFGCRHFVLLGHDLWMEVMCTGVEWSWADPASEGIDPSHVR